MPPNGGAAKPSVKCIVLVENASAGLDVGRLNASFPDILAGLARTAALPQPERKASPFARATKVPDSGPIVFHHGRLARARRLACREAAELECDLLICSLISLRALDIVGAMEESFFIDQLDTEWCFRAHAAGYNVFGWSRQ